MGLINVSHSEMTQSVIDLQADLLKNPFYLFNDRKGTPVDYYNIDNYQTTLDNGLKITYDNYEDESSLRFSLIHDFYIYGIERVALSLENGEFGVSSSEITGEAVILPDTITPYPGDRFVVNMVEQKFLFIVTSVNLDTFDNKSNYWKIEYILDHISKTPSDALVVKEYNFVSGNIGTQFSPVLLTSKWNICKILDDTAVALKKLFKGLYFNEKVQTYTFVYLYRVCQNSMNSDFFYDPYMIKFCIIPKKKSEKILLKK